MKKNYSVEQGFTLIEILLVIGIITLLMAIVIIAVNPVRVFSRANNTSRANGVKQILNAIDQYAAENRGNLPAPITTSVLNIKSGTGNADLCSVLIPTFIAAMPEDPSINSGQSITSCTNYDTGYTVVKDANNRVTVSAPLAQLGLTISVTQ